MITQRVKLDVNNQQGPTIYARMGEKNLRQIVFILTRKDEESGEDVAVDIPSGAVGQLRILKPSNNFVIVDLVKTTLESGSVIFTVTLPEQAVTVGGLCYYDVRIEETTSKFVFSATGHMIVDDAVISSGVLEDVSEVNGVVFPDDFYTKDDQVAIIDDTTISNDSTWSSEKISDQIDIIDDNTVSTNNTWSSKKINDEIKDNSGKHEYSTNEKVVGKWIDGKTVYEMVVTNLSVSTSGTNWISFNTIDASTWNDIIDAKIFRTLNSGKMSALPIAEYTIIDGHPNITIVSNLFDSVVTTAIFTYTKTTPIRKKVIK